MIRKVNDSSLAAVAVAIQQKGGTSAALVFPDGFVSAIEALDADSAVTPLSVTPTDEEQVFNPPAGYKYGRVTVAAIPQNYGKISFDGATLRVE